MDEESRDGATGEGAACRRPAQVPLEIRPQGVVQGWCGPAATPASSPKLRSNHSKSLLPGACSSLHPFQVGSVGLNERVVLQQAACNAEEWLPCADTAHRHSTRAVNRPGWRCTSQRASSYVQAFVTVVPAMPETDSSSSAAAVGGRIIEPATWGSIERQELVRKSDDLLALGEGAKKEQRVVELDERLHVGKLRSRSCASRCSHFSAEPGPYDRFMDSSCCNRTS